MTARQKPRRVQLVEEVMHPAMAAGLGLLPIAPLPAERHRVIEADVRMSNPPSPRLAAALRHLHANAPRRNPRYVADQLHLDGRRHGEYSITTAEAPEYEAARERRRHDVAAQRLAALRTRPRRRKPKAGRQLALRFDGRQRPGDQLPLFRNPSQLHAAGGDPEAHAISEAFHGTPNEVIRLDAADRRPLPADVVDMGEIPEIVYRPDRHSSRGGSEWEHKAGDRGLPFGMGDSKAKPHLVVDPRTKRAQIAYVKSPMRLDPHRGLVG